MGATGQYAEAQARLLQAAAEAERVAASLDDSGETCSACGLTKRRHPKQAHLKKNLLATVKRLREQAAEIGKGT